MADDDKNVSKKRPVTKKTTPSQASAKKAVASRAVAEEPVAKKTLVSERPAAARSRTALASPVEGVPKKTPVATKSPGLKKAATARKPSLRKDAVADRDPKPAMPAPVAAPPMEEVPTSIPEIPPVVMPEPPLATVVMPEVSNEERTLAPEPLPTPPLADKPVALPAMSEVTPQERLDMIQEAAYFRAERHNFDPAFDAQNWEEATREIDEMLSRRREG